MNERVEFLISRELEEKSGELNLRFASLKQLPKALGELRHLRILHLGNNDIKDLSPIIGFESLLELEINHNSIRDLSPIAKIKSLRKLSARSNLIDNISPLSLLNELNYLDLNSNEIGNLEPISNLTGLIELNLSNNSIKQLRGLEKLTRLKVLSLRYNSIKNTHVLRKLKGLQCLYLDNNFIEDIEFLKELQQLEKLSLKQNKVNDISPLGSLKRLKYLQLSSNSISDLSPLREMKKIINLSLSNNNVTSIRELIPLVKRGKSIGFNPSADINLEYNPINSPPEAIFRAGYSAIINWFDQLDDQGEAPLYEAKLMILGQGGAGKTTFSKLQVNPVYKVEKGRQNATLGIKIHRGKVFVHTDDGKTEIKAHLWDFGGQNIQKMLHQFFITENCLYVLVSDKRRENTNFDYWFQIINLLGPKSSVVVLENEMDAKGNNESFAINKYRSLFPELDIEVCEVNLALIQREQRRNWQWLNATLSQKLSGLEIVNRDVPKRWTFIRDELTVLKSQKYITTRDFFELCEKPEIDLNEEQAQLCLLYLNSLGDLVYFNEGELKTYIFLDHEWLTKGVYYILADEVIEEQQGRFTREQAYRKWGKRYKRPEKDMLLLLLLKDQFDLCYELLEDKDVFITPLLLPNDQPEMWGYETNLHFQYNYGFMPHGIFSRAIVRVHEKIDGNQLWQTGVRLYDKDTGVRAEVQQFNDPEDNLPVIDIKISGDKKGCKSLLNFVRRNIEPLHKEFSNLNFKERVGCNCIKCADRMKKGKKPTFYDFKKLQRNLENGRHFVDCDYDFSQQINISHILNDVVLEKALLKGYEDDARETNASFNIDFHQTINGPEIEVSPNIKVNPTIDTNNTLTNTNTITVEVKVQVSNLLDEMSLLKEDINGELAIEGVPEKEIKKLVQDVELAEKALEEIETTGEEPKRPVKTRIRRFFDDLQDENSSLRNGLNKLRKGRDYGVKLAEGYNKMASNFAMPLVPPAALEVIKSI